MRSFAGGRLNFLKLGSVSAGFDGRAWNFLESHRVAKSLLFSVMESFDL